MLLEWTYPQRVTRFHCPFVDVTHFQNINAGEYSATVGTTAIGGVKRVGVVQWAQYGDHTYPYAICVIEPAAMYRGDLHNLKNAQTDQQAQFFYNRLFFWREVYKYALQNNANVQRLEW